MSDTRWLDADEQGTWRALVSVLGRLNEQLDRQLQRDTGIPLTYYEILVRLSETPGRELRMSELAEQSEYSRSRLSHAVSKLEKLGWVRRKSCPTDKRGQLAELTDEGMASLVTAAPGHVSEVRKLVFDPLSRREVELLGEICGKLRDSWEDSACPEATTP
ncbi:MarR family transcriptional regulator [Allokutzneria sp. A3M-2-11 16]|uniref:MarR family winged helix-turn-helix transcriptional regulator n=1 Tax=Allokutzneria sp. A3M-2-11 16 TaxID=2962043 RepID=UPI0020B7FFDB|nr:MarR family transcriptional regulator [Allokutzneria sp. A3M-2-11 16]MCP3801635.1 MarR family transcriptional regulator [Allokutzneria sp. A3M-2-11 16]